MCSKIVVVSVLATTLTNRSRSYVSSKRFVVVHIV